MSLAKNFEQKFKEDWIKSFPNSFCYRLPDQQSHYKNSTNISDFICFTNGKLFLMEIKTHKGKSLPFSVMTQYDKLIQYSNCTGVYPGFIVWFYETEEPPMYVPAEIIKSLIDKGEKSFGLRHLKDYKVYKIPSVKRRTYWDSNYNFLLNLED